jgi:hypothetical protein
MRTPFVSGRRMDSFERLLKTPIFFRLRQAPKNHNAHSLDLCQPQLTDKRLLVQLVQLEIIIENEFKSKI